MLLSIPKERQECLGERKLLLPSTLVLDLALLLCFFGNSAQIGPCSPSPGVFLVFLDLTLEPLVLCRGSREPTSAPKSP